MDAGVAAGRGPRRGRKSACCLRSQLATTWRALRSCGLQRLRECAHSGGRPPSAAITRQQRIGPRRKADRKDSICLAWHRHARRILSSAGALCRQIAAQLHFSALGFTRHARALAGGAGGGRQSYGAICESQLEAQAPSSVQPTAGLLPPMSRSTSPPIAGVRTSPKLPLRAFQCG